MATNPSANAPNGRIRAVLHHITDDLKTIAQDEVELARIELQRTTKTAAVETSILRSETDDRHRRERGRGGMMRDPQTIEREITTARECLEHDLGELEDIVRDKLDVKKPARAVAERGKDEALELYRRVRASAIEAAHDAQRRATILYRRARANVRQHPEKFVLVAVGSVALTGAVLYVVGSRARR